MLTQFRKCYPQGSLTSELLTIDCGQYIVRVSVQVEGIILATGLAAARILEEAEDKARQRALEAIDLTSQPSKTLKITDTPLTPLVTDLSQPQAQTVDSPTPTVKIEEKAEKSVNLPPSTPEIPQETIINSSATVKEEKTVISPVKSPEIEETPIIPSITSDKEEKSLISPVESPEIEETSVIPSITLDKEEKSLISPVESPEIEETPLIPSITLDKEEKSLISPVESPEIEETPLIPSITLDKEEKPLISPVESPEIEETSVIPSITSEIEENLVIPPVESPEIEEIATLPFPSTIEDTPLEKPHLSLVESPSQAKIQPEAEELDFSDIIVQSNAELKRLRWTQEEGRDYLIRTYGKRSRQLLSDEELLEFLHYLQSLPTPPKG